MQDRPTKVTHTSSPQLKALMPKCLQKVWSINAGIVLVNYIPCFLNDILYELSNFQVGVTTTNNYVLLLEEFYKIHDVGVGEKKAT